MKTAIKATIIGALIASFAFVLALAVHWQHKYDSAHFEVRKLTATTARQQQVSRKELHDWRNEFRQYASYVQPYDTHCFF